MKNHTCVSLLACLKSLITVLEINNNIKQDFTQQTLVIRKKYIMTTLFPCLIKLCFTVPLSAQTVYKSHEHHKMLIGQSDPMPTS
jgi:hypothetical protein